MLGYALDAPNGLAESIEAAAVFHDLGKLDPKNQAVLRAGRDQALPLDHMDAGVAHLWKCGDQLAAWLVRAHHAPGIPGVAEETSRARPLRGVRERTAQVHEHRDLVEHVDARLGQYLHTHRRACDPFGVEARAFDRMHGTIARLALSCLVDADHTDTAAYDDGIATPMPDEGRVPVRWIERLEALDAFVAGKADDSERSRHRAAFYDACRNAEISSSLARCEGPVGIGKTTAVTAHLLRRAIDDNLRHLIIVAPYTNIITQVVEQLRKALVLPGERPEEVVAEHHHRADFESREDRDLATLWRAPVVVTTAVQFFETLASNIPARLRKLHELPGSAVFLDEAHAALPTRLWPQNWRWLRELAEDWRCRFVFASGSLARFWTVERITGESAEVPDLVEHGPGVAGLRQRILDAERTRIRYEQAGDGLTIAQLCDLVRQAAGPRLVILNTVQTAAVVAKTMRDAREDVLHLSTALCPRDRDRVLVRIYERLTALVEARDKGADRRTLERLGNWMLVATSCVEAGVDLSFRTAFRERSSAASLIQVGGRVNRHHEADMATVYDFVLLAAEGVTQNPDLTASAAVLRRMFKKDGVNGRDPSAMVTEAMTEELRRRADLQAAQRLTRAEAEHDYPTVAEQGRVIRDDTVLVVVDPRLRMLLEARRRVKYRTLLHRSVQLRRRRVEDLGLAQISGRREVYVWGGRYDAKFLGYMEEVLANQSFVAAGGGVV